MKIPLSITMMILFLVLLILSRISQISGWEKFHHIPVTTCDLGNQLPPAPKSVCVEECSGLVSATEAQQIFVFNTSETAHVTIADCKKFQVKKTFTETWTFSTFEGEEEITQLVPNYSECYAEWGSKCSYKSCSTQRPTIDPEYHWASDTHKSMEYIARDAHQETIAVIVGGDTQLIVHGRLVDPARTFVTSLDSKTLTMWGPFDYSDTCPWTTGTPLRCMSQDDGSLYCPQKGIALRNITAFTDSRCPNLNMHLSSHHILFRSKLPSENYTAISPYMKVMVPQSERESVIQESVNSALRSRDALSCARSCLEFDYAREVPQLFGNSLILPLDNTFVPCNILPYCDVIFPLTICPETNLIKVRCSSMVTWWNMSGEYTYRPSFCHSKSVQVREVNVTTSEGIIQINSSGAFFTHRTSEWGLIVGHVVDPVSIISLEGKPLTLSNSQLNPVQAQATNTSEVTSSSLLEKLSITISNIEQAISHKIRVVIFTIIVLIIGYLIITKSIAYWTRKRKTGAEYSVVYTPTEVMSESTPSFKPRVVRYKLEG
ncbi:TPA_asm: G [Kobresia betacytorhabdovirus 1]|nr:TPA_asm: G [Kobresia betacytorhabdovirus 1]